MIPLYYLYIPPVFYYVDIVSYCDCVKAKSEYKVSMDRLDGQILEALQNEFPLSICPYAILAEKLGVSEDELWGRIEKLLQDGVIRRIGASLDSRKLGFSSTLAAVSVDAEHVERAAEVIGKFFEVTHSYQRNDEFNIWFTIIACDEVRIGEVLEQIRSELSLDESKVLNLPMTRLFKLDARFEIVK